VTMDYIRSTFLKFIPHHTMLSQWLLASRLLPLPGIIVWVILPRIFFILSFPILTFQLVIQSIKFVCVSCQLGKSRQLSFSDSSRESTAPLEILHYDVWSISTPSLSGCRYYVIFIDDFTRLCWMFPISNKSDVYSTFVEFKLLVEKQFHSTIRQF
jgi:hypothetical protein